MEREIRGKCIHNIFDVLPLTHFIISGIFQLNTILFLIYKTGILEYRYSKFCLQSCNFVIVVKLKTSSKEKIHSCE